MKAPWWFCCGWWSPWCVLDTAMHRLGVPLDTGSRFRWVCDKHDNAIMNPRCDDNPNAYQKLWDQD